MKNQAFNPFLPGYEYIPDAEPYVFGDRVYIYGSHDCFDGKAYCYNDYVCWSAPVDDLSDWQYEGFIYEKTQDPMNADEEHCLYAPDVVKGLDGRYYLYYALDRVGIMAVAVCDTPAGDYEFLDFVKYPNGTAIGKEGELYQFDPGVFIDDDGRIYLYSGFAPRADTFVHAGATGGRPWSAFGSFVMELEPDMVTIKGDYKTLLPTPDNSAGTGFEGHEYFEASSPRKINGKYYLVYSSINSHELCYAVSDRPDEGYVFGGTIVSIADVYLDGRNEADALNYMGNTHGGMVEVNGQWYIFYHRQTNLHQYSRQACAEKIYFQPDGSIKQVEVTSCGLNPTPLEDKGTYPARIACNLMPPHPEKCVFYAFHSKMQAGNHPYFTQDTADDDFSDHQYIAKFGVGAIAGFKYFDFKDCTQITVRVHSSTSGKIIVGNKFSDTKTIENPWATIEIHSSETWVEFSAPLAIETGIHPLYFTFTGEGDFDFLSFTLS
jgi:hypothetical protein